MMRKHDGPALPLAFLSGSVATFYIRGHVIQDTKIIADKVNSWSGL